MRDLYLSLVIIVTLRFSHCYDLSEIQDEEYNATATALEYTNRVLICLYEDQVIPTDLYSILTSNYPQIHFELYIQHACSEEVNTNFNQFILAVIAPEPIEGVDITLVPIYFYDQLYLTSSSLDVFRNAVVPADWRFLRLAFTRFIQEQQWSRIAIISDDSWYSAEFEEGLVRHFQEKQLAYHEGRCVQVSPSEPCDFDEAINFLKDNAALIVVANVGHEHAPALLRAVLKHETTPQNGFVWLTRDWRLSRDMSEEIGVTYSFTLEPKLRDDYYSLFADMKTVIDNYPPLTSLLHGVSLAVNAVQSTEKDMIDNYYREIARHMRYSLSNNDEIQAHLQKIVNAGSVVIAVGTVTSQDVRLYYRQPAFRTKIYDVDSCFMRSEVFAEPCNDVLIMIFIFVLMISVIMIFLLTFFFSAIRTS